MSSAQLGALIARLEQLAEPVGAEAVRALDGLLGEIEAVLGGEGLDGSMEDVVRRREVLQRRLAALDQVVVKGGENVKQETDDGIHTGTVTTAFQK